MAVSVKTENDNILESETNSVDINSVDINSVIEEKKKKTTSKTDSEKKAVKKTASKTSEKKETEKKTKAASTKKTSKSTATKATSTKKASKSTTTKSASEKKASTKKSTDTEKKVKKTTKKVDEVKKDLASIDTVNNSGNYETLEKLTTKKDIFESIPKSSKNDLPKADDLIMKDDLNHVEILKKKMQAQKKLNEEVSSSIKSSIPDESSKAVFDLDHDNKLLEEDNKLLASEIEKLKFENQNLKDKVTNLEDESQKKDEKIIVLTNSIVGKASEAELAKEIEILRKENSNLKAELNNKENNYNANENIDIIEDNHESDSDSDNKDLEISSTKQIDDENVESPRGIIGLKIKLLNERIALKEDKIKEVENELNNLSEKDIVEESFTSKIKEIRSIRADSVHQANSELEQLAKLIKKSEQKVNAKKRDFELKSQELDAFIKSLENKPMNYTDKEEAANTRTRLTIEKDSLFIDVETNEGYYKKLLLRYKNRFAQAEERYNVLEKAENDLIKFYLDKLKEDKTNENEEYNSEVNERERLLNELNYLSEKISKSIISQPEELTIDSYDIENITKEYTKILDKLNLINKKHNERTKVEKILLKNEPKIKEYYESFWNCENCKQNIIENNNRIKNIEIELNDEKYNSEALKKKQDNLLNLISEDKKKVDYYTKIIEENSKDEKVQFYIQLIDSLVELESFEKEYKNKAEQLLEKIKVLESE